MLALDEQAVRWYWCMFEFECVITLYTRLLLKYTTMALTYGYALMLIEYGTVSY